MSIMENLAVALHYPNLDLFYSDIYMITGPIALLTIPLLMYLRYKKIINFITLKCLGMMTIVALVIVGSLYAGWSWLGLFIIFMMYVTIIAFEAEMQKGEQNQQNNCPGLDGEHKKEKGKLSRKDKMLFIVFVIGSFISAIIIYLKLSTLK